MVTDCICVYCKRTAENIAGSILSSQKINSKYTTEVLYLDSKNNLTCARCVTEHDIILRNEGKAIINYRPTSKKFLLEEEKVARANKTPVILDEEPIRFF